MVEAKEATETIEFSPQVLHLSEPQIKLARKMLAKEDAILARNAKRETLLKSIAG